MHELEMMLNDAAEARRDLIDDPAIEAYRLFSGESEGCPGLVIERFGPVLIAQLFEDQLFFEDDEISPAVEALHQRLGTQAVYRKYYPRDRSQLADDLEAEHHNPQPWIGRPVEPSITIREHDLRFTIHPYEGYSVGLFLENRDNRRRIAQLSAGKNVLNTFSYTGGFSVAAAVGKAASVTSVDLHKRYLEWSKENFAANELDTAGHWFFCSEIFDFFKRAERQGRQYDLIILDPPTFGRARRPKRTFILDRHLDELVATAAGLLTAGGHILLCTNNRQVTHDRLEQAINAAPGQCRILERTALPPDFACDPDYAKSLLAQFI